ncbi:peptidyl-prolyl cis-trans isomerase C [Paraburkholderia sp. GAS33]|uniref:peptidyl-prolyl cis-trans isomerase n=1 Tax=Paraburkholderia sp. GAS33 TaxID=3035130 RepID=UPI003D1C1336
MKKQPTLRQNTNLNLLCAAAFISVILNMALPGKAHAAPGDDVSQTGVAIAHPFGLQAVGTSGLPQGVVARVNGVDIPEVQLDNVLRASRQPDTPQVRQAIRQDLITRELFRQDAEKQHYDTKPDVQAAMNAAKVNSETQLYLKDNLHPEPVTDAQVRVRYEEIVASMGKDEYKPRVIVVADDATAKTVLQQLKGGTAFDALARQYSVAMNKAAGGEMTWVSFKIPVVDGETQGLPLPVAQAITQLPVGAVVAATIPVADGSNTLHVIVKLDAKRPTQVPAFDQAKDTIRQQLQALALEKAAAQFTTGLLKNAQIQ